MFLEKIISGGQTGADRAALDFAIEFDIPHGGWLPLGRLTEEGKLPETYNLTELPTRSYPVRTEKNVVEGDGTVVFSHGSLEGGSLLTQKMAKSHQKPCLHLDLLGQNDQGSAKDLLAFVHEHQIRILNIAGPRASGDPQIYDAVRRVLRLLHTQHRLR